MLRDGYYLSTYLSISDINNILGTCVRHDQNMALWKKQGENIDLVHYWEFERYTGEKHQYSSFYSAEQAKCVINHMLDEYDITLEDIVEIWGTPELEKSNGATYVESRDKRFTQHSYAHLFSSLLFEKSFFDSETILALEVDGGPDGELDNGMYNKYLYMASVSCKGSIIGLEPIASPALFWLRARNVLGMEEGTLMALGSACNATYNKCDINFNDIFSYKDYLRERKKLDNLIEQILHIDLNNAEIVKNYDIGFSEWENRVSMIVKIIAEYSIKILTKNIDRIKEKYNLDISDTYLALSGGFALNCPINTKIMVGFKKYLLAPPCVNDSGISLGLGLWKFYDNDAKFTFSLKNSYWGKKCSDIEICSTINNDEFKKFITSMMEYTPEDVVSDIINEPIVWVNGRAEIGPRALGARSILGDPRNINTKTILNDIKQRQWWRPVAPIVIKEKIHDWFENAFETKYMLNTFIIKNEKAKLVPAVCHLDGSARVQTLSREDNCMLYDVLTNFYERTNVPMLCNTSLNDKGEPIINTINEALHFALKKNIRVVYIDKYRIELAKHEQYTNTENYLRPYDISLGANMKVELGEKIEKILGCLTMGELHHYLCNQYLFKKYDLSNMNHVLKLKKILSIVVSDIEKNI